MKRQLFLDLSGDITGQAAAPVPSWRQTRTQRKQFTKAEITTGTSKGQENLKLINRFLETQALVCTSLRAENSRGSQAYPSPQTPFLWVLSPGALPGPHGEHQGKLSRCFHQEKKKRKHFETYQNLLFLIRLSSGETILPEPILLGLSEPNLI